MAEERIQRYLARAGVASRRRVEAILREGRVLVNGRVAQPGQKVDPGRDRVLVDGKEIEAPGRRRTLMLHKPVGVISSASDPRGRTTVVDLVGLGERLYPVGRLDYDSEGLILLTNDGDLAYALTHPRHGVAKTYRVWVAGEPSEEALERLRHGVELDGRLTAPAVVRRIGPARPGRGQELEIVLREGRNRQIRRMCRAVGHRVLRLRRVAIGPLRLGGLASGRWRWLSDDEVARLRRAAGRAGAPPAHGGPGRAADERGT